MGNSQENVCDMCQGFTKNLLRDESGVLLCDLCKKRVDTKLRVENIRACEKTHADPQKVQQAALEITGRSHRAESRLAGVSFRGWLAFLIIATMCAMSLLMYEVTEPLKSAVLIAMGFYFGQRK